MSHRYKQPKQFMNAGSLKARMRRSAEMIQDQETLDRILAVAPPAIGKAWLDEVGPFLKFVPRQFQDIKFQPVES